MYYESKTSQKGASASMKYKKLAFSFTSLFNPNLLGSNDLQIQFLNLEKSIDMA